MPKKKSFIDKKNAVTFHLVHRSQKDPLQADEDAPKRVLVPAEEESTRQDTRLEEQRKFGIFYDDDYDYLQHLRDVDEINEVEAVAPPIRSKLSHSDVDKNHDSKLQLPSIVFGTAIETDTGLLNKATPLTGPQLDWDPDIVAGLDEDFDFDNPENQLDDDFMQLANEGDNDFDKDGYRKEFEEGNLFGDVYNSVPDKQSSDEDVGSDVAEFSDEDGSDIDSMGEQSFGDIETKTRFTNYSMSSSVMKRNDGLTLLDDRFEKLYEQYEDDDIGALDHEEIGGHVSKESQLLNTVMEQFEKEQQQIKLKDAVRKAEDVELDSGSDSDDSDLVKMVIEDKKDEWDCESILSTYSNIYNHPKTIKEPSKVKPINLTKRAGIPIDVLPERGLTLKQIENDLHLHGKLAGDSANTYRPKDETSEERKSRKKAVKTERKIRREEKKANKMAFREEKMKQQKDIVNIKRNLQGMTIV